MTNKVENGQAKMEEKVKTSNAELIWNNIKNRSLEVFALKKKVSDMCSFLPLDTEKCYLSIKASSVLPALETAIQGEYDISLATKYVIVEKKKPEFQ